MLVVCIFASALGALIMCLLVLRSGFSPISGDPARADHDLLLTRLGHAAAGACFAITAILATVLVARSPARPTVTASDPTVSARITALDRERQALGNEIAQLATTVQTLREQMSALDGGVQSMRARLDQTDGRVAKTEDGLTKATAAVAKTEAGLARTESALTKTDAGVARAEAGLKRLGDDLAQAAARARPVERPATVRPTATPSRETVVVPPSTPSARTSVRRIPAEAERAHESASPTVPDVVVPAAPAPPSAPAHVDPPATNAPTPATPAPKPTASAAASARKPAATAAPENLPETRLTDKIRKDWDTVRRGFESAGDEITSAMRRLGRRVGGHD